jgi:hypothetical protein
MIGDHYMEKWAPRSWFEPHIYPGNGGPAVTFTQPAAITREEFDALRREVAEMKELLQRAKAYDERNNEPECELEAKMDVLRKVAKLVGAELEGLK